MLVKSPGFVGIKPVVTVVVLLECCLFTGDGGLVRTSMSPFPVLACYFSYHGQGSNDEDDPHLTLILFGVPYKIM